MLLLRAIFSLFESRPPVRADLPPPPQANRRRDFVYGLIIGSAVLCGCFWLLYLDVTQPTPNATAANDARSRASQMKDADSRPISVSLTFFEDTSAPDAGGVKPSDDYRPAPIDAPETAEVTRKLEIAAPAPEFVVKPSMELVAPPTALLQPSFDLPAAVPVAPASVTESAPPR